jgi:hypothetical protein
MSGQIRYSDEFKIDAVAQVTERGYPVKEMLTLNRRYFQLGKPLERRLYELARKHCGQQSEWKIGLEKLHAKTGSNSTPKEFKRMVVAIIEADREHGHMPDYRFELEGGILMVTPKQSFTDVYAPAPASLLSLHLKPNTR